MLDSYVEHYSGSHGLLTDSYNDGYNNYKSINFGLLTFGYCYEEKRYFAYSEQVRSFTKWYSNIDFVANTKAVGFISPKRALYLKLSTGKIRYNRYSN
jgi:hypothetical protein